MTRLIHGQGFLKQGALNSVKRVKSCWLPGLWKMCKVQQTPWRWKLQTVALMHWAQLSRPLSWPSVWMWKKIVPMMNSEVCIHFTNGFECGSYFCMLNEMFGSTAQTCWSACSSMSAQSTLNLHQGVIYVNCLHFSMHDRTSASQSLFLDNWAWDHVPIIVMRIVCRHPHF